MEISSIAPFLDYFDRIRERTMRVIICIPPEKIEWRAAEGKFTLGDLARHIAAAHEVSGLGIRGPVQLTVAPPQRFLYFFSEPHAGAAPSAQANR